MADTSVLYLYEYIRTVRQPWPIGGQDRLRLDGVYEDTIRNVTGPWSQQAPLGPVQTRTLGRETAEAESQPRT